MDKAPGKIEGGILHIVRQNPGAVYPTRTGLRHPSRRSAAAGLAVTDIAELLWIGLPDRCGRPSWGIQSKESSSCGKFEIGMEWLPGDCQIQSGSPDHEVFLSGQGYGRKNPLPWSVCVVRERPASQIDRSIVRIE